MNNPEVRIEFRQFLEVGNDYEPVSVKFHWQRSPFARFGLPEAAFLSFKLTVQLKPTFQHNEQSGSRNRVPSVPTSRERLRARARQVSRAMEPVCSFWEPGGYFLMF